MKKYFFAAALMTALVIPMVSSAATFRAGEQIITSAQQEIGGDLYLLAGSVTSAGPVQGDIVTAGGNVLLDSTVEGDVLVGGGTVTVLGTVGDDVRVIGGNITVNSSVGGDVVVAGGQVQISGKNIGGDLAVAAGTVTLTAPVAGNVRIRAGEVFLGSQIQGSVDITAEKIVLGNDATIGGDFMYSSSKEAQFSESQVGGQVLFTPIVRAEKRAGTPQGIWAILSVWVLLKFLMMFIAAVLIGLWLKKYSQDMVTHVIKQPMRELGRGFVTLIILPVASVLLLVTIVGIPLGILGMIALVGLSLVAALATPIVVGGMINGWIKKNPTDITWLSILVGVIVYMLLGLIPIIGWIAKFIIFLMTLGAVTHIKSRMIKEIR